MLKNYISKLVCLATLCAFFLQPQWFEGVSASQTQQNQELNISKTTKLLSYVVNQSENESDDNSDALLCFIPEQLVARNKPEEKSSSSNIHTDINTLHRLQERPIWLTSRKIIL